MKFFKNKKLASLHLSINAIVILILAITMLGLGLGFMRNIFGKATEEFTRVGGTVQKQMIDQMRESNRIVNKVIRTKFI
jgi:type II secretory pathway pseudopilin PulG